MKVTFMITPEMADALRDVSPERLRRLVADAVQAEADRIGHEMLRSGFERTIASYLSTDPALVDIGSRVDEPVGLLNHGKDIKRWHTRPAQHPAQRRSRRRRNR